MRFEVPHRILILNNEFEMGGVEKKLFDLIARTDRSRFQYAVCCLKGGGYFKDRIESLGVPFHENLLAHRFDAFAIRAFNAVIRRENTELIYTFAHPNTVIFSYLAKKRGLVNRVAVSFHATGGATGGRQVPRYLLPMLRRFDALVSLAEAHREYLSRSEGLPKDSIRVIPNGVDTDLFHPPAAGEAAALRRQHGIAPDALVVMGVASLKPLKCIDLLIRATAPILKHRERDARLVIVGRGPQRQALESLASELGVADRVIFTGLRDDVESIMRMADMLVISSWTVEAFPNVALEAMATGLPVVSTDVGSVRELVEDGRSALVVPAGDEGALRAAIARLLDDDGMRRAMGARGREIVEAKFRIEDMCRAREAVFEELLSADGSRRPQGAAA